MDADTFQCLLDLVEVVSRELHIDCCEVLDLAVQYRVPDGNDPRFRLSRHDRASRAGVTRFCSANRHPTGVETYGLVR